MPEPTPLEDLAVNDRFWLGQGRKIVESRVTSIEDAGGKLVTAIGWFWTVYTAAALVGVSLSDRDLDVGAVIVIFLPALVLIIAYGLATWVLMPVYTSFIVNSPEEVEAELTKAYDEKRKRLLYAVIAVGLATLLLLVAVGVTAWATPRAQGSFSADVTTLDGDPVIAVGGWFSKAQATLVTVEPGEKASTDAESSVHEVIADDSGRLDAEFPLEGNAATWTVTIAWSEDDVDKTQSIEIEAAVEDPAASTTPSS